MPINYNDSLNSITSKSSIGIYLGISYYTKLSPRISFRPTATMLLPATGQLVFERKTEKEKLDLRSITESISILLEYKLSDKGFKPYLSFGPAISILLAQGDDTKNKVEFKTFNILGQVGFGGEKRFKQFKIKPELQYSFGFLQMRKNKNNIYNNTIGSLKANSFSLTFYISDLID